MYNWYDWLFIFPLAIVFEKIEFIKCVLEFNSVLRGRYFTRKNVQTVWNKTFARHFQEDRFWTCLVNFQAWFSRKRRLEWKSFIFSFFFFCPKLRVRFVNFPILIYITLSTLIIFISKLSNTIETNKIEKVKVRDIFISFKLANLLALRNKLFQSVIISVIMREPLSSNAPLS